MTFIIYCKSGCADCDQAKELLEKKKCVVIVCDNMIKNNRTEFIKSMELKTRKPFKSFPLVFSDDEYVGGLDELTNHLMNFSLDFCNDFELNEEF